MKCVRCREQLKLESYEGVEIDRCLQCQGVWLDAGELAKIVGATNETFSGSLIAKTLEAKASGVPRNEKDSEELCPKCSTAMKPINYSYESGVIIDSCPSGHGIWFDSKELEKVQVFKENEDKKLKTNRTEWHKLASAAKAKAETDLETSSMMDKISQFVLDWLG
jgi:Zn-finger nucleic acid-binding protein